MELAKRPRRNAVGGVVLVVLNSYSLLYCHTVDPSPTHVVAIFDKDGSVSVIPKSSSRMTLDEANPRTCWVKWPGGKCQGTIVFEGKKSSIM